MKVLVTGGAGYIGSHACVELLAAGCEVLVLDNLCNSKMEALSRVACIADRAPEFVCGDVRDGDALSRLFAAHCIDAVIHFAGLKAVGESVEQPLAYYDNNVHGSLALLRAMDEAGVRTLVFSSSATVYGDPASVPIREDFPLSATNPYGRSKLMVEDILRDLARADARWRLAILRYFNPVGAHESGLIGEDPAGIPNNLMPFVSQVAAGRRPELAVFGDDYPTPDGTGVRDYIHVVDLARGHLKALDALRQRPGVLTANLGTGRGYSVLEVVAAFARASGRAIPYRIAPRRAGDVAACYADPAYAAEVLGWRAEFDLDRMCADAWRWQSMNPDGYGVAD
ncbi:UDP-glucose 4-epimerase GalE [Azospira restricta]|uniref:UDP-glucose 4-epimerase n=1 Tax=Azospira restricta TaxID=404405 RepID=A0A974SPK8_9RHOO|nr:UDP-glucose 4-epimerase GalE [Azospira restricta]QRJ64079.1 UDP-glucose 4-epimerase GalE [Azospira restricta]